VSDEHAVADERLLPANTGRVIDQLLGVAAINQSEEITHLLEWARLGLRSGRPRHDYVWPDHLTHPLARLLALIDGQPHEAIADVFSILSGQSSATSVSAYWDLMRRKIPASPRLELAQFTTTHSFDDIAARFGQHINSREPMEVLIRGHLWIEASVGALLDQKLMKPQALEERLSFYHRLSFANALGIISDDDLLLIRRINKLRNRMAHQLDTPLIKTDEDELISLCTKDFLWIAGLDKARGKFPQGLASVIATLVIGLRQQLDDAKAIARFGAYLQERIDRTLSVEPSRMD